jgi:hypothetical protein
MMGNFLNKKMMGKMEEMQKQMEETKGRLANISVRGEAVDGKVVVIANGNRLIESIKIDEEFLKTVEKEELEEMIKLAANRALEQAERVEKSEMSHAAMGILPNLGL